MRPGWWMLMVCLGRAAAAQPADQDPQAQARQLYAEGSKHYELREYADAIAAFKRAYSLFPEPTFLFDIAQAYRLLHSCDDAAGFYRNYMRATPDANERAKADKLRAEMETCAADERAREEAERQRQLAATMTRSPQPDVAPAPSHRGLLLTGIATASVGAVISGVGVYYSLDAASNAQRVEKLCATGCNAKDVAPIDAQGKSSSDRALVLYGVGGVALAAGAGMIAWTLLHSDSGHVIVTPQPGGATVSTMVRF